MNTIALSASWDLKLDSSGNIAMNIDGTAIAQDVASAIRLFKGELWYDVTLGVPYYEQVLGFPYGEALIVGLLNKAALTVPDVVEAQTTIHDITNRAVHGTTEVIDTVGEALNVHF